MQLDERELDALIGRELLAPGDAGVCVGGGLVDAVLGGTERRGGLADAVLVHEVLGEIEPVVDPSEHGVGPDAHVGERHFRVVCRHVERPPVEVDAEPGRVRRHEKGGDANRLARLTGRAGEHDVVRRVVQTGVEPLHAVQDPLVAVLDRCRFEVAGVRTVVRFGEAEGQTLRPVEEAGHPLGLLLLGARGPHHEDGREVADDRRFVLQVVVQPEPLCREVLPDDRHLEVRGVAPTEIDRQCQPEPASGVRAAAHLAQQVLPFRPGHTPVVEVGAGPFPPVVEEADVVVLRFQRSYLALDEFVERSERRRDVGGNVEVHRRTIEADADAGFM